VGNTHSALKCQAALLVFLDILANRVDFLEFDLKQLKKLKDKVIKEKV
jgi:hypothetical protein